MRGGLARAQRRFGPRLESAFAIGSLAHGGFAPAASDVDLALVLTGLRGDEAETVELIRREVRQELAGELAGRLSVFWSTWPDLQAGSGAGRFPLADRWDLAEHGRVLLGSDDRPRIRLPAGEELRRELIREGADFMLAKLAVEARNEILRQPVGLAARGCREVTKAVLFPARFLFTAAAGRPAENEEAALHVAATQPQPLGELARAALSRRASGRLDDPETVRALLERGVIPLHLAVIETYRSRLAEGGEAVLAAGLERWAGELSG